MIKVGQVRLTESDACPVRGDPLMLPSIPFLDGVTSSTFHSLARIAIGFPSFPKMYVTSFDLQRTAL